MTEAAAARGDQSSNSRRFGKEYPTTESAFQLWYFQNPQHTESACATSQSSAGKSLCLRTTRPMQKVGREATAMAENEQRSTCTYRATRVGNDRN